MSDIISMESQTIVFLNSGISTLLVRWKQMITLEVLRLKCEVHRTKHCLRNRFICKIKIKIKKLTREVPSGWTETGFVSFRNFSFFLKYFANCYSRSWVASARLVRRLHRYVYIIVITIRSSACVTYAGETREMCLIISDRSQEVQHTQRVIERLKFWSNRQAWQIQKLQA